MSKIQTILNYYKESRNLSLRQFAEELNLWIEQGKYSHQAIKDWLDGRYEPKLGKLLQVLRYAPRESWQYQMAEQLVKTIEEKAG